MKTEPDEWAWKEQVKSGEKGIEWNGVRNFQASKNLRNMKIGDRCFFCPSDKISKATENKSKRLHSSPSCLCPAYCSIQQFHFFKTLNGFL